ncbi:MAG: hypothetical protein M3Z75_29225 [Actinomycetota bacterium]|nr:hypothetical protein [Actinomycetota bacterium]
METVRETRLEGSPAEVRKKVDELGRALAPHEYVAGEHIRDLAVELAQDSRLRVSVLTYNDESQELEVIPTGDSHSDSITLSRSESGTHCQLTWSRWLPIINDADIRNAVKLITAIFEKSAAPKNDPSIAGEVSHLPSG